MDGKPMVIHTKKKPKIRVKASTRKNHKERNIQTIKRSPKVVKCSKVVRDSADKRRNTAAIIKKSGDVQTIKLQVARIKPEKVLPREKLGNKNKSGVMKIKIVSRETGEQQGERETNPYKKHQRLMKEYDPVINKKNSTVQAIGIIGAEAALNQLEGGDELHDSYMALNASVKPIVSTINTAKNVYKNMAQNEKPYHNTGKRIKKTSAIKKMGIKSMRKSGMDTMGQKAGVMPFGAGAHAGTAGRESTGRVIDKTNKINKTKATRNRMIQLFINKRRQGDNNESIAKALKDIVMMRSSIIIKKAASYIGLFLAGLFTLTAMVALPIIGVIAVLYNSPFAIFLPSISSSETTQEVSSAYMADFYRDVYEEENEYDGYDYSEVIYVGYEGEEAPDNYRDIIAVYMVRYGKGDTATDMTDTAKLNLKKVFDDMCSYSISSGTAEGFNEDGDEVTYQIKYVDISLKTYQDMIEPYGFSEEEAELLREIMNPEHQFIIG